MYLRPVFLVRMNLLLVLYVIIQGSGAAPSVRAPWGPIEGIDRLSRDGVPYSGYLGIPFAQPPVGVLRFEKPVVHPGVKAVFNASTYGPRCRQAGSESHQSEDCLQLNVFLPSGTKISTSRKAVLVWIHGGAFLWGNARSYEPQILVTKGDVIVVTVQYRLGIFGFLSTGNRLSPGNYGLWDQQLALEWVKRNINAFGGDEERITIIGESAGASSVAYQALRPRNKGLFRRAVLQSGAAKLLAPATPIENLAGNLGCPMKDYHAIMKCLKSKDGVILQRNVTTQTLSAPLFQPSPWAPVLDGDFFKKDPLILMQEKSFLSTTPMTDIDVMVGVNNNEGGWILYTSMQHDRQMNTTRSTDIFQPSTYEHLLTATLDAYIGTDDPAIKEVVRNLYTYSRQPSDQSLPKEQVFNTYGDPHLLMPGLRFARLHASLTTDGATYVYLFDNYPSFMGDNPIKGINHGEDTLYLFHLSPRTAGQFLNTGNISTAEYKLSETFAKFIAEFGKHGNTDAVLEAKLGQKWPQFDNNDEQFLAFSTNMSVGHHLYPQRASIWLDVIPMLMSSRYVTQCNTSAVTFTSGAIQSRIFETALVVFTLLSHYCIDAHII